jgi:plastocyanin
VNIKRGSLAAVAAISLLLVACGDDDDTSSSIPPATDPAAVDATSPPATGAPAGSEPAAGGAEIVISGFEFSDDPTVAVGATVAVRNDDSAGHTLTADDGAFDSGSIDGGGTAEITLTEAGTFPFHCEVHPDMTGTITVTG